MLRKLVESLIIELYTKYEITDKIKNPRTNNFYFLSDLIDILLNDSKWSLSRNIKDSLPKIKKKGDWSAHNRYFIAKKPDLDDLKPDIRITLQELILQIDFKNIDSLKRGK